MAVQDDLIAHFDRGLQQLRQELEAYPDEKLLWMTEGHIANSAGNLCFHLIGNLNHFIGAALGETGYLRDRPREFAITDVPRDTLIKYIEQTRRMIWQALRPIGELTARYPEGFREESQTVGSMLFRLLGHLYYHVGQINYHRRLLTAPKTN